MKALLFSLMMLASPLAVAQLRRGRYLGTHDSCGSSRRKVYAVETNGLRYRFDRHGNMTAYYSAALKYTCN